MCYVPRTKPSCTSYVVRSTCYHPRRGPFGSAAPVGLVNPKERAMGSCRRDRHTASLDSAGPITGGAADHLTMACGPVDPALTCGENSWPGRVHHRLEDSRKAIL